MPSSEGLQGSWQTFSVARARKEMQMICHQDIGMYLTLMPFSRFLQAFEKESVVVLGGKDYLTVVDTLDDMSRLAGSEIAG